MCARPIRRPCRCVSASERDGGGAPPVMDALLLALLLTLVLEQGARSQQDIARLGKGVGGLALVVAANAVFAAALGSMIAALLMPDARLLFLAIALLMGAGGLLIAPFRKTASVAVPHPRGRLRTLFALFLRRAGENAAFATAGVVAFTDSPILAAIGTTIGGWVALVPPLALGVAYRRHLLFRLLQLAAGGLLLCLAIGCAASAMHIT